jgi:diaminohydroxyphosphoribosylaminopyrimidine deaminase/5-amino-6-(5-phosphoribosylamino)uracil reductase
MTESAAEMSAWMRRALDLARRGWGRTHPNPMVGALAVIDGEVVAEGWHRQAGGAHAEVDVLRQLGAKQARRAILVITLEPCSTQGRTPACTEAVLKAGVRQVVVGTTDPNPAHAGRGIARLREAGLAVEVGFEEEACRDLNRIFFHAISTGQPFLSGKIAQTLDGKIAARDGSSRWITGPEMRAEVHRLRALFPTIGVGAGTVLADDPALTVPQPDRAEIAPLRLVFDRQGRTVGREAMPRLYTDEFAGRTRLIHSGDRRPGKLPAAVVDWQLPDPATEPGVFLDGFAARCRAEEITGVLLEGGAGLLGFFLDQRRLDELSVHIAPKFLGDPEAPAGFCLSDPALSLGQAFRLDLREHRCLGPDTLVRGTVSYPES